MKPELTVFGLPVIEVDTMPVDALGVVELGPKRQTIHVAFSRSEQVWFSAICKCGFHRQSRRV